MMILMGHCDACKANLPILLQLLHHLSCFQGLLALSSTARKRILAYGRTPLLQSLEQLIKRNRWKAKSLKAKTGYKNETNDIQSLLHQNKTK